MQISKYILVSFSSIVCTLLGVLLFRNVASDKFCEITLFQILQLLITIAIGIYVSYFLNHKNSKETKKKEAVLKLIDDLNSIISQNKSNLSLCFDDMMDVENKKQIQLILRSIENKIEIMKKIKIGTPINNLINECSVCSSSIKDLATGNGWGIQEAIPPSEKLEIERNLQSICTRLDTLQVNLLNM